jgi:hypothetical protein
MTTRSGFKLTTLILRFRPREPPAIPVAAEKKIKLCELMKGAAAGRYQVKGKLEAPSGL